MPGEVFSLHSVSPSPMFRSPENPAGAGEGGAGGWHPGPRAGQGLRVASQPSLQVLGGALPPGPRD